MNLSFDVLIYFRAPCITSNDLVTMLTINVLNEDCLIAVFTFLDVESLTNVVTVDKVRHLAAAQTVYKRKFASGPTILDSNDQSMAENYLLRLNYFGDYITDLTIKVPKKRSIMTAIHDRCQQSLNKLMFHYDSESSSGDDDQTATHWFFERLDHFPNLRSLHCKYGELQSNTGSFDRLNVRIPKVPSLNQLIIDGFGGRLEKNLVDFLELNPQIEEFFLWTGYENLYASYLKYIAEKMLRLKVLDIRFAVFFHLDGGSEPLNFENLEKLRVVSFFNLENNYLPFLGDTINKLEDLDYTAVTTTNQLINIVSQFKQLKQLKIGSYGLVDDQLMTLANNLEKLKFFQISVLPSNYETPASFTANGIKKFLDIRTELNILTISFKENDYDVNMELISDIKQIFCTTRWVVLEQNFTETRYIVIFNH